MLRIDDKPQASTSMLSEWVMRSKFEFDKKKICTRQLPRGYRREGLNQRAQGPHIAAQSYVNKSCKNELL